LRTPLFKKGGVFFYPELSRMTHFGIDEGMKTLPITVDSHLRLKTRDLKAAGLRLRDLLDEFEYDNPEYWKKKRMGFYTGDTPRKLSLVVRRGPEIALPRGGWDRLKDLLPRDVSLEIRDETVSGTSLGMTYAEPADWTLDPDQLSAARAALRRRQGFLIGPCSSGKTEILLKFASDAGERTLVIVHTERILKDWAAKVSERFFVPAKEVGLLYGKAKRERTLTIGMVRTVLNLIEKDPDFVRRWGTVILDEAHHASAATFSELINSFPARYRIAATATPKRKDGKEVLTFDAFGSVYARKQRGTGRKVAPRVLFEITDADLDRYGRIIPVDVVVVPTEFDFDLNHARRMEADGWEQRAKGSQIQAAKDWAKSRKWEGPLNTYADMLDEMSRDAHRQARILEYLLPEVRDGQTCVLLADRREFCLDTQAWLKRRKIPCGRLMGGRNSKEQDRTAKGLSDGSLLCAVGTTVADEGMDIGRLSRGFGCTPAAKNPGRLTQQLGRFKRKFPGKTDAVYFYFWDRSVPDLRGHARAVFNAVKAPHRVWFSERPGERVPMTRELLRRLEDER